MKSPSIKRKMEPNRNNNWILYVGLSISIIMAGYAIYHGSNVESDTTAMRKELYHFADSISEVRLKDLKFQAMQLDSAIKLSQKETTNKKREYEEVKKPDIKYITTVQLDSFWTNYANSTAIPVR